MKQVVLVLSALLTTILITDAASTAKAEDGIQISSDNCHFGQENGTDGLHCEQVLEKGICWPRMQVNTTHIELCPSQLFNTSWAYAKCMQFTNDSGSMVMWRVNDDSCKHQTTQLDVDAEVSLCLAKLNQKRIKIPNSHTNDDDFQPSQAYLDLNEAISLIGYLFSSSFLLVALAVLRICRHGAIGLDLETTKLHSQLFMSFILRAVMSIIKYYMDKFILDFDSMIVDLKSEDVKSFSVINLEGEFQDLPYDQKQLFQLLLNYNSDQPQVLCKAVTFLWQYSLFANYSWLMAEGIYLVMIMIKPLRKPSPLILYVCIGWLMPLPFVVTWAILRQIYENSYCWIMNMSATKIFLFTIRLPTLGTIIINFINFIFVFFTVSKKMFFDKQSRQHYTTLNLFKSTSVLIVIFGLHYFICSFFNIRDNGTTLIEKIMFLCDLIFTSFQGMIVAYVYCLQNAKVRQECRRRYIQHFSEYSSRANSSASHRSNTMVITLNDDDKDNDASNDNRFSSIASYDNNIQMQTFNRNAKADIIEDLQIMNF